jgi:hypothetical protein
MIIKRILPFSLIYLSILSSSSCIVNTSNNSNGSSTKDMNKDATTAKSSSTSKQEDTPKPYFSGTCVNISNNSGIETQEVFNGGIINCGIVNYVVWNREKDAEGSEFQMTAKILASNHQWKIGSTSEVEGTKEGLSILMSDELSKQSEEDLKSKLSIQVTVGSASIEGDTMTEKERAHERAISIRKFVAKNYGVTPKYMLNLGKFKNKQCEKKYFHEVKTSKYQRPIILINIRRESNSSEPDESQLKKIIKKNLSSLGFGLSYKCYSDFDLTL